MSLLYTNIRELLQVSKAIYFIIYVFLILSTIMYVVAFPKLNKIFIWIEILTSD